MQKGVVKGLANRLGGSSLLTRSTGRPSATAFSRSSSMILIAAAAASCHATVGQIRLYSTTTGEGGSQKTPSSSAGEALKRPEISSQMNDWSDSFAEARELIKDATDSIGSVYFSDDIEDAAKQTEDAFQRWDALKSSLMASGDTATVERLEREHGLKMKQLQQELEAAQQAGGE